MKDIDIAVIAVLSVVNIIETPLNAAPIPVIAAPNIVNCATAIVKPKLNDIILTLNDSSCVLIAVNPANEVRAAVANVDNPVLAAVIDAGIVSNATLIESIGATMLCNTVPVVAATVLMEFKELLKDDIALLNASISPALPVISLNPFATAANDLAKFHAPTLAIFWIPSPKSLNPLPARSADSPTLLITLAIPSNTDLMALPTLLITVPIPSNTLLIPFPAPSNALFSPSNTDLIELPTLSITLPTPCIAL